MCVHSRLSGQQASWDQIRGAPFSKEGLYSGSASHGTSGSLSLMRETATFHRLQGLQAPGSWYCQQTPSALLTLRFRLPSVQTPVTPPTGENAAEYPDLAWTSMESRENGDSGLLFSCWPWPVCLPSATNYSLNSGVCLRLGYMTGGGSEGPSSSNKWVQRRC